MLGKGKPLTFSSYEHGTLGKGPGRGQGGTPVVDPLGPDPCGIYNILGLLDVPVRNNYTVLHTH